MRPAPALPWLLVLVAAAALGGRAQEGPRAARPSVRDAIARVAPSVVRVEALGSRRRADQARRHLFREVAQGREGAGLIVGASQGASQVVTHAALCQFEEGTFEVTTQEGRRVRAALLRLDARRELALLRAEGDLGAPAASLGSSHGVAVGELVLALGDPFAMARDAHATASLGVLEGRTRLRASESAYAGEVLLTDAAINPGSEGGALVDLEGDVVGILAPLARDRRTATLVGHALPVEDVLALLAAPRATLGLLGRAAPRGLLVARVLAGGPAERAGVRAGDVVTALGDAAVAGPDDLRAALAAHAPGDEVTLVVQRAGAPLELRVRLGAEER